MTVGRPSASCHAPKRNTRAPATGISCSWTGRCGCGAGAGCSSAWVAALLEWWPEVATFQGSPDADPGAIKDPSRAAVAAWHAREDSLHARLLEIDASRLEGRPEWVTYGFLREALELGKQSRVCRSELLNVDQRYGWQVSYPLLGLHLQPVGTEALREAALRRFGALPRYLDAEIENLREGLRQRYSAPRVTVERVLAQVDGLLQGPAEASPFYGPARRDSTEAFRTALRDLVAGVINPAIANYRDFLRDEYLPRAPRNGGLGQSRWGRVLPRPHA